MTLKNRFSLVAFGVILFLITTPILVLYARGFQIDWNTYKFVKTGAMVIKTHPTKATVFLNNRLKSTETPLNLRFLPPADYEVRIEKDGYQTWTKRLTVRSQLVTWVNDNRKFIVLFLSKPKLEQTWPADQASIIFPEQGVDFDNQWYFETGQLKYKKSPTDSAQIITDKLPPYTQGQIIPAENQVYLILDYGLYALNGTLEKIYSPVNFAKWDRISRTLIYGNDNEILHFYPNSKNSDLVFRSLKPVKNAVLNSETGYVFFQTEQKVKAIELDARDRRNIFEIIDLPDSDSFVISDDGKKLYTIKASEIEEYSIR